ncbi:hypothetical protein [Mycoplasmopsis agassizii]|uniref:hypothetical protein n=1 Tax=Mycoplasmopsis agassizii TaxID=33922 RepID=UPI00117DB51A|nr:hypothetical protein [Mycoplasmopsis agassizii]
MPLTVSVVAIAIACTPMQVHGRGRELSPTEKLFQDSFYLKSNKLLKLVVVFGDELITPKNNYATTNKEWLDKMKQDYIIAYSDLKDLLVKNKDVYQGSENNISMLEKNFIAINNVVGPDDASYIKQFKEVDKTYDNWVAIKMPLIHPN